MRTATANFLALNDDPVRNPIWIMIISGLPANRGSFASGNFADIDSDFKKHIQNISLHFNRIDLLEPHTDANEYEVEILDKDLAFTNVMKDYNIYGQTITIKIGFAELAEADFVVLPTVTIERISLQSDHLTWTITAKDNLFKTKQKLFNFLPTTNLSGNIAIGASTITVDDTTGFRDPSAAPAFPSNVLACIVIDQELKSYTGISGNSFTGCTTRGATGDVAHNDNATIKQAFAFNCNPIIAALHVLITTPDGTNGFYDLGVVGMGPGIPAANFMIENIEKTAWRIINNNEHGQATIHIGYQEENLDWTERTCLRQSACYFSSNNGKIDVGAIDYVWYNENFSTQRDFVNEEILALSYDFSESINIINLRHGKKALSEDHRFFFVTQLDDGVSEYIPNNRPFEQFLNDQRSEITGGGIDIELFWWHRRFFDTYGDSFAKVKFETTMAGWLIEPGDDVTISYDHIPELITGTRGWTNRRVKILGQDIDFSGKCSFVGESWQILNRVAGLTNGIYTINEVLEVNINDTALAFSAVENASIEAADAYYNNITTNYAADLVVFFIELIEPSTGTGNQTVTLRTMTINSGATITGGNRTIIRYNAAGSATHTIAIYGYVTSNITDIDTAKVDWVERSSAVAADQPTLTLKKLWFIRHNRVISAV